MDQCSNPARHPISATGDPTNRPGHDRHLGIDPHSRFSKCSPAGGSVISLPRQGPKSRQRRADRFPLGSQFRWRIVTPLPAALQKSHHNGGRVLLIFVADPTGSPAPSEASVGTTRRVEEGLRGDAHEQTRDRTDRYRGSYSQKLPCRPWLDVDRPKGKQMRASPPEFACGTGGFTYRIRFSYSPARFPWCAPTTGTTPVTWRGVTATMRSMPSSGSLACGCGLCDNSVESHVC